MNKIYIFGHKKPDTDSVCSAICLSYLKNELGYNTTPAVLGELNSETKFVLDYWHANTPKLLEDVKLQIKDLAYGKDKFVNIDESIYDTFSIMEEKGCSNIPVVDDNKIFLGTISMKEISKDLIMGDFNELNTTYDKIIKVLNGKELLKFDNIIDGDVLVASYKSTTFIENIDLSNKDILIVGDRHSIIEYAVNKAVKLVILTGSSRIKDEHLEIAKKNHVNIIKTELNTFDAARRIILSKPIKSIMNNGKIICFNENDEVNDFIDIANKTRYSHFPVINNKNKCLGVIKLADCAKKSRKKVILVDHNEYEQSVDGLNEAEIIEIIDHHKIGSIGTSAPINFRNMPVGSTNTILYMLFKESNINIPKNIAGLMLSGIISDTLLLASPTTTETDRETVESLAKIAKIDYKEYGMQMFKAGSSLKDKTVDDIFFSDFKNFTINNKKIGISQISTISVDEILNNSDNYISLMNNISKSSDYDLLALYVVDILNNGSYIFYSNSSFKILNECYKNLNQGKFLPGIISRKKQIIPIITEKI